jgi:NADH:ubiquinone oxidoreductase subunit F (NADH-binding)/CRP-like cAMP-binding protein/Fe-S-cluster-containing dehydrogenase component/NADH:ubiquinone oxidoreductase subunit E
MASTPPGRELRIIPELRRIQDRSGYLERSQLQSFSTASGIRLYQIQGVASFFPHFRLTPPAPVTVRVCRDMACHMAGSASLVDQLRKEFGPNVAIEGVSCLGRCDGPPAVSIAAVRREEGQSQNAQSHEFYCAGGDFEKLRSIITEAVAGTSVPTTAPTDAASNYARSDWRIDPYQGQDSDYAAVKKLVATMGPAADWSDWVLQELNDGNLRGMGGAGIPAAKKWRDVRDAVSRTTSQRADGRAYVIVNGDESEPGTFKDRELLLHFPHLVLEGLIIAGLVTGATEGFIYIRHEYTEQIEACRAEIRRAESMGVCGANASLLGRSFRVSVFVSPGGYICGEQSALVEAMSDRRGEPRNMPPGLETNGLDARPTLLSNVETFAWVPYILCNSGQAYAALGEGGHEGARFFSVSGDVNRPGVYEVPVGLTLRELICGERYCQGIVGGNDRLKAIAPSGPSGGFLPRKLAVNAGLPRHHNEREQWQALATRRKFDPTAQELDVLDLELELDQFRALSPTQALGAGIVVYNDTRDMAEQAVNAIEFFRNESCGKCVPCRIGSQKLANLGTNLLAHEVDDAEWDALRPTVASLLEVMNLSSMCGLGRSVRWPLQTLIDYFPQDVREHTKGAAASSARVLPATREQGASRPLAGAGAREPSTRDSAGTEISWRRPVRTRLIAAPGLSSREDDEGLFSRDVNGQLVPMDAPTEANYDEKVHLAIDDQPVVVPLATRLKDAQGNIVVDAKGRSKPRYSTIYDALLQLNREREGAGEKPIWIPTLCHQAHMTPVAVCRMCVVQIYGMRRGQLTPERKLLPACQHQVKEGMKVFTMDHRDANGNLSGDAQRVRQAVNVLANLLATDHLKEAPDPAPKQELAPFNELQQLLDGLASLGEPTSEQPAFGAEAMAAAGHSQETAGPPAGRRTQDRSSPAFLIDHTACILCDRCSRACNEVKQNHVIGRTGKGRTAGIGFDLNDCMRESACVQCGECMISCPTSAITFTPIGEVKMRTPGEERELIPLDVLKKDELFKDIPAKLLLWQKGLVWRRKLTAGDTLCEQGEPGNSAFILKQGEFEVRVWPVDDGSKGKRSEGNRVYRVKRDSHPLLREVRTAADRILGEMACLSGTPRSADALATTDAEVWEIRRNVLDRLMRSPQNRPKFEAIYRRRAVPTALAGSELFSKTESEEERRKCSEFIAPHLEFVRLSRGRRLFREGDIADSVYFIRLGHVRVESRGRGRSAGTFYLGPGKILGEIAMLSISRHHLEKPAQVVSDEIGAVLSRATGPLTAALPPGRRTATCSALDDLEMVRLDRETFLTMLRAFPGVRDNLVRIAMQRLGSGDSPLMPEFLQQGLYQGQSLLVLDLDACTRCDECVRACIGSHDDSVSRLVRDGNRFGKFLVPHSCRSCKDANCMRGCPVDAIHRGRHLQIIVEDHCIGCGLCARNCPFENIEMSENQRVSIQAESCKEPGKMENVPRLRASTCDLCDSQGREDVSTPRCVYMCPHDAAHRWTGEYLFRRMQGNSK